MDIPAGQGRSPAPPASMQFDLPSGIKAVPDTLTAPVWGEWQPTRAQYTDSAGNAYQWHARWHRWGLLLGCQFARACLTQQDADACRAAA